MRFTLSTSGDYYYDSDAKKNLEKIGFKFKPTTFLKYEYVIDYNVDPIIEFKTLEELVEFSKEWGEIILIGNKIEIYNDYRE